MNISRITKQILAIAFVVLFFISAVLAGGITKVSAETASKTFTAAVGLQSSNFAIQGELFAPKDMYINEGDTIVWKVKTNDIHTVTFLKKGDTLPPFNPFDPKQSTRQGNSEYDGVSYYNSGIMSLDLNAFPGITIYKTYSLQFNVTGDFTYYDLVMGSMVMGKVHVRPAGTPYPFSPQEVNEQIREIKATVIDEGGDLIRKANEQSDNRNVTLGIGGTTDAGYNVSIVRFFPQVIHIEVGQSIKFTNDNSIMPHTLSFGNISDPFTNVGDLAHFDGSGPLNHLFLPGDTATLTPVKTGTYHIYCAFHDTLGMVATLIVTK